MFTKGIVQEIVEVVNGRITPLEVEGSLEDWGAMFTFKRDFIPVHEVRISSWDLITKGTYSIVEELVEEGR